MKILAIETSCDDTAASVIEVNDGEITVLSNVVSSQIAVHEKFGGVVPMLAAREHAKNIDPVFEQAMQEVFPNWQPETENFPIDLIAVTYGPGLGPSLLVGIHFAKALAKKWNTPIIGVDHMDGHVHSNWLSEQFSGDSLRFPVLNLIVSGGHTDLVLMPASPAGGQDHGDYEIIGETMDDAVGETFDKVARLLDLSYPGGPKISKLALQGNPALYPLPRPMLHSKDLNFSYSGLKTAVLYLIRDLGGVLTEQQKADIAASFQDAAIDVLIQKTKKAAQQHGVHAILLSGGVSANAMLREKLQALCDELNMQCVMPELKYTTDNAAMIAAAAYFKYQKEGASDWDSLTMDANLRMGHNTTT